MSAEAPALGAVAALAGGPAVDGFGDGDPGRGHAGGQSGRESAWSRALTEMEAAADRAEHLLRVARSSDRDATADVALTAPWRTPRGLGPLPAVLAQRAAALVERQRDLVQQTAQQLGEHRRSLRLAESMRTAPAPSPVYLDAEA